jgi:hypothetical protein
MIAAGVAPIAEQGFTPYFGEPRRDTGILEFFNGIVRRNSQGARQLV